MPLKVESGRDFRQINPLRTEENMATYLMQFSFTQQGIEKIKQLSARGEAVKKTIRQMGGEVQAY